MGLVARSEHIRVDEIDPLLRSRLHQVAAEATDGSPEGSGAERQHGRHRVDRDVVVEDTKGAALGERLCDRQLADRRGP